jgi:hypothetical protein
VEKEDFNVTLKPLPAFQLTLRSVIILIALNSPPPPPPAQVRFEQLFNPSLTDSEINQVVIVSLSARGETYVTYCMLQSSVRYQD